MLGDVEVTAWKRSGERDYDRCRCSNSSSAAWCSYDASSSSTILSPHSATGRLGSWDHARAFSSCDLAKPARLVTAPGVECTRADNSRAGGLSGPKRSI